MRGKSYEFDSDSYCLQVLARFNQFLRNENERVYKPKGVEWVNPLSNGLLHVSLPFFFNTRTRLTTIRLTS